MSDLCLPLPKLLDATNFSMMQTSGEAFNLL